MDDYISEVGFSEQTNMMSGTTTTRQLKGLTITVIENSALNPAPPLFKCSLNIICK